MIEHVIDMSHEREVSQIDHSEFGLAVDGLGHTACHNQRFESDPGEDIQCLLVGFALTQKNADLSGPSTVHRDVEVSDSEDRAVLVGSLESQKLGHLLCGLIECPGL